MEGFTAFSFFSVFRTIEVAVHLVLDHFGSKVKTRTSCCGCQGPRFCSRRMRLPSASARWRACRRSTRTATTSASFRRRRRRRQDLYPRWHRWILSHDWTLLCYLNDCILSFFREFSLRKLRENSKKGFKLRWLGSVVKFYTAMHQLLSVTLLYDCHDQETINREK